MGIKMKQMEKITDDCDKLQKDNHDLLKLIDKFSLLQIEKRSLKDLYYSKSMIAKHLELIEKQIKHKQNEAMESFICIICFDRKREILFLPCNHCVSCAECSGKLE